MRGRCSNLITLSSSPSPVPPTEAFSAIFYLISWPFTLFFGLLPVFWVSHDTPRYICYMIAKEFGSQEHLSFPQTSAQISTLVKKNPVESFANFFFQKKNGGILGSCKRSSIFGLPIRYKPKNLRYKWFFGFGNFRISAKGLRYLGC